MVKKDEIKNAKRQSEAPVVQLLRKKKKAKK